VKGSLQRLAVALGLQWVLEPLEQPEQPEPEL